MSEIIAKAMNSTMGTSKFRSFDRLLNTKSVVSGDTVFCEIGQAKETDEVVMYGYYNKTGDTNVTYVIGDVFKFKLNLSGTVSITVPMTYRVSMEVGSSYTPDKYQVSLRKNGSLLAYEHWSGQFTGIENRTVKFEDVAVNPNDEFVIRLSVTINSIAMSGSSYKDYSSSLKISDAVTLGGEISDYIQYDVL